MFEIRQLLTKQYKGIYSMLYVLNKPCVTNDSAYKEIFTNM